MHLNAMSYAFSWLPGSLVSSDLLRQLAELYSGHYGTWSLQSPINPGGRVRLSASRIGQLHAPPDKRHSRRGFANEYISRFRQGLSLRTGQRGITMRSY